MTRARLPTWISGPILALPAAAALFFRALIADILLPEPSRKYATLAVLIVAATGACGRPVIGTTMSEWHVTTLLVAAFWLVIRNGTPTTHVWHAEWMPWLPAGLLVGLAVGLKLTGAAFGLAFDVLVLMPAGSLLRRGIRLGVPCWDLRLPMGHGPGICGFISKIRSFPISMTSSSRHGWNRCDLLTKDLSPIPSKT